MSRKVDDEPAAGETNGDDTATEPVEGGEPTNDSEASVTRQRDTEARAGVRESAVDEVDQRIVDVLSWLLDTETRAKIYVHLLATPDSTADEVATGTGLYPSTVREALAELHAEGRVSREKRQSEGAGNNPYEYAAIKPSELVGGVVEQVQRELNTIFRLDRLLDREAERSVEATDPVTITVDDAVTAGDENGESVAVTSADPDGAAVDSGSGDGRVAESTDSDATADTEDDESSSPDR